MKPWSSNPFSRREMLRRSGCGFGYLAFSALFADVARLGLLAESGPLSPKTSHHPAKAKRVIFLFMHGGPSHVDTFDPKPLLKRDTGKELPKGFTNGPADPNAKLLGSQWEFKPRGQSGLEISDLFPEVARCADDLCVLRGMHTNGQDHSQAVLTLHTGSRNQVRPSMGAWVLYGLGTANQNLPGFITISPSSLSGGAANYGSAFLPAVYQATPMGQAGAALTQAQIRHISNGELSKPAQRRQLDFLQSLNREHLEHAGADDQIEGVIQSYELAFRMQTEAPELTDISQESKEIRDMYGVDQTPTDDFARQCLLARRMAERGVRFIQVNHNFKWDQHQNLKNDLERNCREVDQPISALLRDLKQRDMLKDTLVLWGGEFGRTPSAQGGMDGRDHNPSGFSVWMAGGGVKGGMAHGATDDYGFQAVVDKSHTHDLHATMLHLLGMNHEKLTFRHGGRDYRLTDVYGNVIKAVLA